MKKDPIEKPLRQILADDEAPPFAAMWARARIEAEKKREEGMFSWRWLFPGSVMAGITVLVFGIYWAMIPNELATSSGSSAGERSAATQPGLAKLKEIDPWISVFEGLESDWPIESDNPLEDEGVALENAELAALSSAVLGGGGNTDESGLGEDVLGEGVVYESPTDFLLQMEIPLWFESEERSVL